mgnify:CR=1 FL=1
MENKISPELEKNIRDLSHDRYLQKSHAWVNIGLAAWLAFIAILATWIIEGDGNLNATSILIGAVGTAIIGAFCFSFYWVSKRKRLYVIKKIEKINLTQRF